MITMAQEDYLTQLLRNMQGQLDSLSKDQKEIYTLLNKTHEQTVKTNGRVNDHQSQLDRIWRRLSALKTDSIISKLDSKFFLILAIALLVIVVGAVGSEAINQTKELIK